MKHTLSLRISVAVLGLLIASESFAGGKPPWVVPETGITKAQSYIAASLKEALAIEGRKHPDYKPARRIKWSTKMRNYGISNIDTNSIKSLLSGHYFVSVYRPLGNKKYLSTEKISVRYYGNDGKYFSCWSRLDGGRNTYSRLWKPNKNSTGFGGWNTVQYKKSKQASSGFPILYDSFTGSTLMYSSPGDTRSHPIKFVGHFQKEYAPVFKDVCPNIPNNGIVNAKQLSPIYAEFVKDARIIKNIPTRFKQDIDDPLTLGMYYSIYGPDE